MFTEGTELVLVASVVLKRKIWNKLEQTGLEIEDHTTLYDSSMLGEYLKGKNVKY